MAAWRSIRAPRLLSRIGPWVRVPIARPMAPPGGWWQRDQDGLGAFTAHAQYPVAVFFAQVGDVRTGGLEDPQAEQPEHGYQREIARAR